MASLTDKQRLFVERYLTCWNATEAARQAGYKDPELAGWENRQKPAIQAEISQRLAATAMTANEVLARLADQARSSMSDFLDETGRIDLSLARKSGKLHLIKSRSVTKEGERIELYSAQEALALLAKHHGLFIDRQETGPPGAFAPIRRVVVEVTPDEPVDDQ